MLNTVNPANLVIAQEHWLALSPLLILTFGIMLCLLATTFKIFTSGGRYPLFALALAVLGATIFAGVKYWVHEPIILFNGMLTLDYFSSFFTVLLSCATILTFLTARKYLESEGIHYSEFYPLLLLSTLGMIVLVSATELLTLFIALELMSLAVYVLVGLRRRDRLANEAAIKYFVMGGVAAAIYLYGTALIYGATTTTKFSILVNILAANPEVFLSNPVFILGVLMVLGGFFFKVAAVPFHMWTPDVYEGAPLVITSYMATALKAAVFAAMIRVVAACVGDSSVVRLGDLQGSFHALFWWLALLTMLLGNTVALWQQNVKRMLAYSSIAHTGYLLVGILAGVKVGFSAMLLYLVAYAAMNIGAFAVLSYVSGSHDRAATLDSMAGLAKRRPWAAAAMTIFLLSLGGLPPTAGFVGKYFMFTSALEAGETLLVLLGVLTSVISLYYYLRIVVQMYMQEAKTPDVHVERSPLASLAVAICVLATLYYGIFPQRLLNSVQKVTSFYTVVSVEK